MKHFAFPYLAVAWLISTIVSVTARTAQPLQKPGSLRASGAQYLLIQESRDHHLAGLANAVPDDGGKGKKDQKSDGGPAGDKPPPEAIAPEGDDPAKQVEKDAAKQVEEAVPETLPPKEEVRLKDVEAQAKSAAELTGVRANEYGEVNTLFVAFSINGLIVLICMLIFSGLRLKFPLIYSANVLANAVPFAPSETFFGWVSASLKLNAEMVASSPAGLDAAMLIEFCTMNCKILAVIGIPSVCIMCPLHLYFGGGGFPINAVRCIGMANVIEHHPWLYYVHAVVVNCATIAIVHIITSTMKKFLRLRYGWLKALPAPRSVTLLVEGIPPQWRSDAKLKEFFGALFNEDCIHEAVMVKNVPKLKQLYEEQIVWQDKQAEVDESWAKDDYEEDKKPMMSERMCLGEKIDAVKHCNEKLEELKPQVGEARRAAMQDAETVGGVNTSTGFVTFTRRRQACLCQHVILSPHRQEWVMTAPPPASDVLWNDLKQEDRTQTMCSLIAYFLVVALYLCFIPLIVVGTNLASMIDLGYFQPLWASFAPGLALMLLLGFLPTILLLIFRTFFTLKADAFAQHKLQIWYFVFLLFFVILVTCIGQSLFATFKEVMREPEQAMWLMAEYMPTATQFYMEFLMIQCTQQGSNFLRTVSLAKFLIFSKIFGHEEDVAKDLAEPEDQDYYGMGSRSARFTVNMLIGIIFCTLSPVIAIFALVLFLLCRLFYGYLIVFAETKKADLGGVFFVTKLQHLFFGTGLYNVLMIGVLFCRARTKFPMLLTVPSLIYTIVSYRHFSTDNVWTDLPFTEATFHTDQDEKVAITPRTPHHGMCYVQPEMMDESQVATIEKAMMPDSPTEGRHRRASRGTAAIDMDTVGSLKTPRFLGEEGLSFVVKDRGANDNKD